MNRRQQKEGATAAASGSASRSGERDERRKEVTRARERVIAAAAAAAVEPDTHPSIPRLLVVPLLSPQFPVDPLPLFLSLSLRLLRRELRVREMR